ncbi:MAG: spore germination protein, partial [Neobacillus sp.]
MKGRKWGRSHLKKLDNQLDQTREAEPTQQDSTCHFTGEFSLDMNLVKQEIGHNSDVHFREFYLGNTGVRAAIIFIDGLSDKDLIDQSIMKTLMVDFSMVYNHEQSPMKGIALKDFIKNQVLTISLIIEVHTLNDLVSKVLTGSTALLVDGVSTVLILGTAKGKSRSIEEPVSEALVRGPRVGFTETLSDNTALLRQHGDNRNLSMINFQVGERAKKKLVIVYIKEIADSDLVEEVKERIKKISIDDVPESGYIEQLIEDNYLSPFPQVQNTERPDRVISALME